jgi:predicted aldo/keto reductase-like oxidoreductase
MLHYIDKMDDLDICLNNGMLDFAIELKEKGIARMIGLSTHVPKVASAAIKTGHIETIMFSVNPLFDLMPEDEGIMELFEHKGKIETMVSQNNARHELYAQCQREDIGIIVMKAFAGGILLGDKSPIKMSVNQCINYALSQPSVVTASLGCRKPEEFAESLRYYEASEKDKDFAQIYSKSLEWSDDTKCVYCNHCLPCPQEIDIADAMRKIDAGGAPPDNCISCGACESRCPFGIPVSEIFCG